MNNSPIQWCDSTINPVAGCDGCELWASTAQVVAGITDMLVRLLGMLESELGHNVARFAEANEHLMKKDIIREAITEITAASGRKLPARQLNDATKELKGHLLKCYAGALTENRAGQVKGYPACFDKPQCFPGRMATAAQWKPLQGMERPEKPWLNGLPRMIFVSDMGDALSASVPFEYLRDEIVATCLSPKGQRHIWLWLTKRPARMAEFSAWLEKQGVTWPDNLVAMTSVTSEKYVSRVKQLLKVRCHHRALSVEPLSSAVTLPLKGIAWVIVGGESGAGAAPFHLEWARCIAAQCRQAGVAFFMKQLGRHPVEAGRELKLVNKHGGDWAEWPDDLRLREVPAFFHQDIHI